MKCHMGFEGCSLENGYYPRSQSPLYSFRKQSHRGYLVAGADCCIVTLRLCFWHRAGVPFRQGICFSTRSWGETNCGLPSNYLTASSPTTHWLLYNLWGKAGKMERISTIHDRFLCFFPLFIFPFLFFVLRLEWCSKTITGSNQHFFRRAVYFEPINKTQPWPKKSNTMTPEKGIGMKQTADRFHQVPWTVFVNSFAPRSSRRAPRSEKSMRWTVSTACVFRMMDVEVMQQLDVK